MNGIPLASNGNLPLNGNLLLEAKGNLPFNDKLPLEAKGIPFIG